MTTVQTHINPDFLSVLLPLVHSPHPIKSRSVRGRDGRRSTGRTSLGWNPSRRNGEGVVGVYLVDSVGLVTSRWRVLRPDRGGLDLSQFYSLDSSFLSKEKHE